MMMTRRKFVGVLSAGTVGLAASAHARDVAAAPVVRGGGFAQAANGGRRGTDRYRIGLETYSFHDVDLDTMLKHVGSLGLEYLELHEGHLPADAPPDRIARTQKALKDARIAAPGVYIHDALTSDEAVARPIFEFAKRMNFEYINGGPSRDSLPLLNRLSSEYGVKIAIHNHGPKAQYDTLEDVTSALDPHPNLAACIDIGHFARSRVDPVNAIRKLGGRTVAVHLKDVDATGGNMVVGEGTIDLPGVFGALRDSRFNGLLVLEYEGDIDNMTRRLAGMRASLVNVRRLIDASTRG